MNLQEVHTWKLEDPSEFAAEWHGSEIREQKNFGAHLIVPIGGVAWKVWGGKRSAYIYQSLPGLVPLYFMWKDKQFHFSMSYLAMKRKAKELGYLVKDIWPCKEGVAYHVSSKGLKRYVVDTFAPVNNIGMTMDKAADQLEALLKKAAHFVGNHKVLTPISAGTDGILTAWALKEVGANQICVCMGRSEEDFDPKFAREYADQLGLDYHFLPVPTSDEVLEGLLERTLNVIEMADFSNVLMGMCNVMLADYAKEHGCKYVVNADIADVALGNDNFTVADFKKEFGPNGNGARWAEFRIKHQLKTLPTNLQIFKAYSFNGVDVIQLFADRDVLELLLSVSISITPAAHKKPLYYEVLNRHVKGGSWLDNGKKVGFYSGCGIGKIRLENPILSDENMRKVLSSIE